MSISYANVVAKKNDAEESEPASHIPDESAGALTQKVDSAAPASATEQSTTTSVPESLISESLPMKEEKKTLTPAPVPSKSVWGSTNAAVQASDVDEHKWPTPDRISEIGNQSQKTSTNPASKFIKPNKWVPISAKVVLPSPRNSQLNGGSGNQLKNKRKNKNTRKNKVFQQDPAANGFVHGKSDESKEEEHLDIDEKSRHNSLPQSEEGQENSIEQGQSQQNYQNGDKRFNSQQQKTYRRFNQNGTVPGQQNSRPQQQPQQRQQGTFYQQFVPQQYQANNRQFRPNGSYGGRSNSNGSIHQGANQFSPQNGGFIPMGSIPFVPLPQHPQPMMGMPYGAPIPVHIPPPISPKQNPQQALTQQIDYYFSLDNLIRDVFLRKNMGTEGWVDLDLILNFKRVKIIVNGIRNSIEDSDEAVKEELLDKSIVNAVQQCQNLEVGYLNGKEANDTKATEIQLRVKQNFEQWIISEN